MILRRNSSASLCLVCAILCWSCGALAPSSLVDADQGCVSSLTVIKERIAVLDLKNQAGVKEREITYLSNLLRQAAGRLLPVLR